MEGGFGSAGAEHKNLESASLETILTVIQAAVKGNRVPIVAPSADFKLCTQFSEERTFPQSTSGNIFFKIPLEFAQINFLDKAPFIPRALVACFKVKCAFQLECSICLPGKEILRLSQTNIGISRFMHLNFLFSKKGFLIACCYIFRLGFGDSREKNVVKQDFPYPPHTKDEQNSTKDTPRSNAYPTAKEKPGW